MAWNKTTLDHSKCVSIHIKLNVTMYYIHSHFLCVIIKTSRLKRAFRLHADTFPLYYCICLVKSNGNSVKWRKPWSRERNKKQCKTGAQSPKHCLPMHARRGAYLALSRHLHLVSRSHVVTLTRGLTLTPTVRRLHPRCDDRSGVVT